MIQLYVDLDRTLFQTNLFDTNKWSLLHQWFPWVEPSEQQRQTCYYVEDSESSLHYYDFDAHLVQLGLEPAAVYRRLRQSALADGRLEYPGTEEFIRWASAQTQLTVLTYGAVKYQQLKVALCPSLERVPVVVVQRPKGEFFQSQLAHAERWLVDDKPIGGQLPPGVRFIQSATYNGIASTPTARWPIAQSLADLPQQLVMLAQIKGM